ncbi:PPE family protein [Mycobacterium sp.]|uniref:PPE family protein n=1 Tax=Mycobacterium sp. TaxID=1785 RepID=UPI0025DE03B2|nr:PPE family protein [Mycobacterium sp.]MBW0013061.1 PPE family protein [Mycobacterium sp.]
MTSPHFAWLPPEINSARIFAGPGAAPLLAAATAWNGLAEDLASSASSFFSVTSDLANGSWQGASAAAMLAVSTQYVSWLSAAAAQAEAASSQASAIAAAFEAAVAATVQPAVVAANRTLVQALAHTNWFGINTPAIMDTEAAYEAMWAADVAAMFGYHADASAAVAQLAPWQQIAHNLGINLDKGLLNFGSAASTTGGSSVGGASAHGGSTPGVGSTTQPSSSTATGTSSNQNLGYANSGNSNIGLGNLGNNNIGLGNTGNNDFGIGLTGNNQFGFGGFNSGTGNVGLFNSGTNNVGFFNSGTGNYGIGNSGISSAGVANPGFFNTGIGNAGLFPAGPEAGLLNSGYVTGGVSAASLSSSVLNSVSASTGGLTASLPPPGLLNPGIAAAATGPVNAGIVHGLESSGAHAAVAGVESGPTPIPPALRTTTAGQSGFFAGAGNDAGFRNLATSREPGIPSSGFFAKGDDAPGAVEPGVGVPELPE